MAASVAAPLFPKTMGRLLAQLEELPDDLRGSALGAMDSDPELDGLSAGEAYQLGLDAERTRSRVRTRRAQFSERWPDRVIAARKALAKAWLTIEDIDLFEVNEAFAAVPMTFMKAFDVPHDKVNVNGGAIAMGHPLGATGAMILGTLIDELHRRGQRYGLATLCVGGGMGIATIVERI